MTAKEFLERLHRNTDKRKSFNTFIKELRYALAMEHHFITSAVDYEQIVMDLADLEEISDNVLTMIEWEDDNKGE